METITNENFTTKTAEGYSLIDMYADWCGPCRAMSPILEQFEKTHQNINVFKIDVDKNQNLAAEYNITSIPCFIILEDGTEIGRIVGAMPLPAFEDKINTVLNNAV